MILPGDRGFAERITAAAKAGALTRSERRERRELHRLVLRSRPEGWSRPFEKGNTLARRHGAMATLSLAPRANEIATELRELVPTRSESDEPTIRLLALVLARIEAANAWLDEHGLFRDAKGQPQPVLKALSTWENTAARLCDRLGLTPTSRAALGLDLSRTADELERLTTRYRRDAGEGVS